MRITLFGKIHKNTQMKKVLNIMCIQYQVLGFFLSMMCHYGAVLFISLVVKSYDDVAALT
jgi:hypothetical protein